MHPAKKGLAFLFSRLSTYRAAGEPRARSGRWARIELPKARALAAFYAGQKHAAAILLAKEAHARHKLRILGCDDGAVGREPLEQVAVQQHGDRLLGGIGAAPGRESTSGETRNFDLA